MISADIVYLSPHFDDAALSCGGLIHRQVEAGYRVLVLTLFGGGPHDSEHLSDLAVKMHQTTGPDEDCELVRQNEEKVAMSLLGAQYHWFDFPSCIYRGAKDDGDWYYLELKDLYGDIHLQDEPMLAQMWPELERFMAQINPKQVYGPLGVGNHVDHQLTHMLAAKLGDSGTEVVYYEDYPYADTVHTRSFLSREPYTLDDAEQQMAEQQRAAQLVKLTEANVKARVDAICAYRSQLGGLGEIEVAKYIDNFTSRLGGEYPVERYWLDKMDDSRVRL